MLREEFNGRVIFVRRVCPGSLSVVNFCCNKRGQRVMQNQNISVVPLLSVRNGTRAIEFYKTAFGAREVFRVENERGEVVARLSEGGAEFWLADGSPSHLHFSPESLGRAPVRLQPSVDGRDAVSSHAAVAGAA